MRPAIVIHYHEIALKGGNRDWFERTLIENIRWALRDVGGVEVRRMSGRVVIRFQNSKNQIPNSKIIDALTRVFGIANILVGHEVRQEYVGLEEDAVRMVRSSIASRPTPFNSPSRREGESQTFAVRVKRGNKQYPMNSMEVERTLGSALNEATGWRVDLTNPDITVHVEIVERTAFVFTEKYTGPGGLPVGVSGRVLCLLSSGFDSPVASWMMMKRGCVVDFVHFHSYPYVSDASMRNVEEIARVLQPLQQQRGRLHFVPLVEYQKRVMTDAPSALRVLLYRRMMVRVANALAQKIGVEAIVTGENLGQVASQTIPNMAAVEAVSSLPIFRPLLGFDKVEIVGMAERIGTAPISVRPYDDCCSLFTPAHPATHATAAELDAVEAALGAEEWTGTLATQAEVRH